jgi:signal transduction histidine kinase
MHTSKNIREPTRILVVDDKERERITLSKLLSKFKVEVHTADSGQAALSQLIRHSYALVLLDIQMPRMDGIETARLMRNNTHTENIPIIFLTAYDKDEINMLQGYKVGAIDYLFKPINEEILSLKVETFLRSYSFEKEKEYERILSKLESKNRKLKKAREKALQMMASAQKSQKYIEEQSKELRRYNTELEQFAYVATHDLRAPIINLNGLIKVFKKRGYETKENNGVVKRIDSSVGRINTTLNDLIPVVAYRKTMQEEVKEIDVEEIFRDVEKDLGSEIRESRSRITGNFKEAPRITYIPGHFRSILQNLMANAIKFHSDQRKPVISVSTGYGDELFYVVVKDNGIGIDETKKEKVFGLFQRLTTTVPGKGMGLFITKSLVESMGGSIDFNSEPDMGTEFRVSLKNLAPGKGI